jgi:hypothetical protein
MIEKLPEIQKLNLAYLQMSRPDFDALNDRARRDQGDLRGAKVDN